LALRKVLFGLFKYLLFIEPERQMSVLAFDILEGNQGNVNLSLATVHNGV